MILDELHRLERIRPLPLQHTKPKVVVNEIASEPKSATTERETNSDPARTLSAQSMSGVNRDSISPVGSRIMPGQGNGRIA